MKLKLDAAGHVVVQDGKPVYVNDDGSEVAFDAPHTAATISRLNGEAKGHRERADAAEVKLKAFDGIEDADFARKAVKTVKNLDDKKLIEAGEVDKIKDEAIKAVEAKYLPVVQERDSLKTNLTKEIISGSFSRSKFIGEKLAIPADLVEARFGKAFSVEDGKLVAKDASGNQIFSRARPGEPADFEEAMESLVSQYPHKDTILKGSGASGSGASKTTSKSNSKPTMTRAQFDALDLQAQGAAAREANIVE